MIRLVAFDFDGTLAETRAAVSTTVNAALAAHELPRVAPACIHGWMGLPLETVFQRCLPPPARGRWSDLGPLVRWYRARFAELGEALVTPMAGAHALLDALAADGLQLAIATSRERSSLDRLLEHLGLTGRFAQIVACNDVARGKPDPELLRLLLTRTGLEAHEVRMVGDTTFDVQMARAAGVAVAAVVGGCHDRASLLGAGPDVVLDELVAVRSWLQAGG